MNKQNMREAFSAWWKASLKETDFGLQSPALSEAFEAGAAYGQRDAMAVAEAVLDVCYRSSSPLNKSDINLAAIVEAVRPGKREAVNQQLLAALKLSQDMMVANSLDLPHTQTVMMEAIAAAEAAQRKCGSCNDTGLMYVGNSGNDHDGNAPEFERCPECGYGELEQPASAQQQGEPVALPFAILPDEMKALHRFHECVTDGEGYDVPKVMMKRLAEIGLVRRVTANIYEHTNFGLSVLNGDFDTTQPAPACSVPDGYALVPLEPTVEMSDAGAKYDRFNKETTYAGLYRAMIAAAPKPEGGA